MLHELSAQVRSAEIRLNVFFIDVFFLIEAEAHIMPVVGQRLGFAMWACADRRARAGRTSGYLRVTEQGEARHGQEGEGAGHAEAAVQGKRQVRLEGLVQRPHKTAA